MGVVSGDKDSLGASSRVADLKKGNTLPHKRNTKKSLVVPFIVFPALVWLIITQGMMTTIVKAAEEEAAEAGGEQDLSLTEPPSSPLPADGGPIEEGGGGGEQDLSLTEPPSSPLPADGGPIEEGGGGGEQDLSLTEPPSSPLPADGGPIEGGGGGGAYGYGYGATSAGLGVEDEKQEEEEEELKPVGRIRITKEGEGIIRVYPEPEEGGADVMGGGKGGKCTEETDNKVEATGDPTYKMCVVPMAMECGPMEEDKEEEDGGQGGEEKKEGNVAEKSRRQIRRAVQGQWERRRRGSVDDRKRVLGEKRRRGRRSRRDGRSEEAEVKEESGELYPKAEEEEEKDEAKIIEEKSAADTDAEAVDGADDPDFEVERCTVSQQGWLYDFQLNEPLFGTTNSYDCIIEKTDDAAEKASECFEYRYNERSKTEFDILDWQNPEIVKRIGVCKFAAEQNDDDSPSYEKTSPPNLKCERTVEDSCAGEEEEDASKYTLVETGDDKDKIIKHQCQEVIEICQRSSVTGVIQSCLMDKRVCTFPEGKLFSEAEESGDSKCETFKNIEIYEMPPLFLDMPAMSPGASYSPGTFQFTDVFIPINFDPSGSHAPHIDYWPGTNIPKEDMSEEQANMITFQNRGSAELGDWTAESSFSGDGYTYAGFIDEPPESIVLTARPPKEDLMEVTLVKTEEKEDEEEVVKQYQPICSAGDWYSVRCSADGSSVTLMNFSWEKKVSTKILVINSNIQEVKVEEGTCELSGMSNSFFEKEDENMNTLFPVKTISFRGAHISVFDQPQGVSPHGPQYHQLFFASKVFKPLVMLDLSWNPLTEYTLESLGVLRETLKELVLEGVSSISFGQYSPLNVLIKAGPWTALQKLDLSRCGINHFPDAKLFMDNFPALVYLDLAENHIANGAMVAKLSRSRVLRFVYLENNYLADDAHSKAHSGLQGAKEFQKELAHHRASLKCCDLYSVCSARDFSNLRVKKKHHLGTEQTNFFCEMPLDKAKLEDVDDESQYEKSTYEMYQIGISTEACPSTSENSMGGGPNPDASNEGDIEEGLSSIDFENLSENRAGEEGEDSLIDGCVYCEVGMCGSEIVRLVRTPPIPHEDDFDAKTNNPWKNIRFPATKVFEARPGLNLNQITPEPFFPSALTLTHFIAPDCKIKWVHPKFFEKGFKKLKYLDISGNPLQTITTKQASDIGKKLHTLIVNRMAHLDWNIVPALLARTPQLKVLHLRDQMVVNNPIELVTFQHFQGTVEYLDVSNSGIRTVLPFPGTENFKIDLTQNPHLSCEGIRMVVNTVGGIKKLSEHLINPMETTCTSFTRRDFDPDVELKELMDEKKTAAQLLAEKQKAKEAADAKALEEASVKNRRASEVNKSNLVVSQVASDPILYPYTFILGELEDFEVTNTCRSLGCDGQEGIHCHMTNPYTHISFAQCACMDNSWCAQLNAYEKDLGEKDSSYEVKEYICVPHHQKRVCVRSVCAFAPGGCGSAKIDIGISPPNDIIEKLYAIPTKTLRVWPSKKDQTVSLNGLQSSFFRQTRSHLEVLELRKAFLNDLPSDFLVGMRCLHTLDLSFNEMTSLPAGFLEPVKTTLRVLRLQGMKLTKLPKDFLLNAVELRDFSYSGYSPSTSFTLGFNNNLFRGCKNLRNVYIGNNKAFTVLPQSFFEHSPLIETVVFDNVALKMFPRKLKGSMKHIKKFSVINTKVLGNITFPINTIETGIEMHTNAKIPAPTHRYKFIFTNNDNLQYLPNGTRMLLLSGIDLEMHVYGSPILCCPLGEVFKDIAPEVIEKFFPGEPFCWYNKPLHGEGTRTKVKLLTAVRSKFRQCDGCLNEKGEDSGFCPYSGTKCTTLDPYGLRPSLQCSCKPGMCGDRDCQVDDTKHPVCVCQAGQFLGVDGQCKTSKCKDEGFCAHGTCLYRHDGMDGFECNCDASEGWYGPVYDDDDKGMEKPRCVQDLCKESRKPNGGCALDRQCVFVKSTVRVLCLERGAEEVMKSGGVLYMEYTDQSDRGPLTDAEYRTVVKSTLKGLNVIAYNAYETYLKHLQDELRQKENYKKSATAKSTEDGDGSGENGQASDSYGSVSNDDTIKKSTAEVTGEEESLKMRLQLGEMIFYYQQFGDNHKKRFKFSNVMNARKRPECRNKPSVEEQAGCVAIIFQLKPEVKAWLEGTSSSVASATAVAFGDNNRQRRAIDEFAAKASASTQGGRDELNPRERSLVYGAFINTIGKAAVDQRYYLTQKLSETDIDGLTMERAGGSPTTMTVSPIGSDPVKDGKVMSSRHFKCLRYASLKAHIYTTWDAICAFENNEQLTDLRGCFNQEDAEGCVYCDIPEMKTSANYTRGKDDATIQALSANLQQSYAVQSVLGASGGGGSDEDDGAGVYHITVLKVVCPKVVYDHFSISYDPDLHPPSWYEERELKSGNPLAKSLKGGDTSGGETDGTSEGSNDESSSDGDSLTTEEILLWIVAPALGGLIIVCAVIGVAVWWFKLRGKDKNGETEDFTDLLEADRFNLGSNEGSGGPQPLPSVEMTEPDALNPAAYANQ
eukprot:Nk52_evm5s325 gene=Nk52_evmTU5s325